MAVAEFVKNVPLVRSVDRRWDEDSSVSTVNCTIRNYPMSEDNSL